MMNRLSNRLAGLKQTAATLDRRVTIAANTAEVGARYVKAEAMPARIVELKDLEKLGVAQRCTWFAFEDREARVDMEVPDAALGDNLPANRIIVHAVTKVAKKIVEDQGPNEWSKSARRTIDAHTTSAYYRCTLFPTGSFAAAQERDRERVARRRTPPPRRQPTPPNRVGAANADAVTFWADRHGGSR